TNLLQKIARALFFFHPAVWWIDARLSLEREMACDDAVLAATGNPRAYAGCLIDLLEKGCARRGWTMAQAAVARARDASVRIARILHVGPAVTTRIGRTALGVAASLALACTGIAVCTPQFVAFVPTEPASFAQLKKPLLEVPAVADETPAPSAMIPAAYHPAAESPAPVHRTFVKRAAPSRPQPMHQATLIRKPAPKSPDVMARLAGFETAQPTMVVFETTEFRAAIPAHLRSITAEPAAQPMHTRQSSENPALQIQVFQVLNPETGAPMQILRIVFVLPQPGSASQSI
ncbi:MAG: M56 family metallopeptidase, partial [Acidobacteriota bacterium]